MNFKKQWLLFFITMPISAQHAFDLLDARIIEANSLVCVGLDPDITKIPLELSQAHQSDEDALSAFLKEIIDLTAPHCCCFKLQKAFYDQFDRSHKLLRTTIQYIHDNYPTIAVYVDCKIGDIGNTMKAYISFLFNDLQTDGVVVNPYMGDEVVEPFIQDQKKIGIILIKTSNAGAKTVQDLPLSNGKKLWEEILQITVERWNKNNNLMIVLGSNANRQDYSLIRSKIPQAMPILLTGIGFQGGDPNVLKQLLNDQKRGVIVNSSRDILYPYDPSNLHWRSAVLKAVIDLKNMLNEIRKDVL